MTLHEAVQVLEEYNKWRKGAEIPQPSPVRIGMAIDTVVTFFDVMKWDYNKEL